MKGEIVMKYTFTEQDGIVLENKEYFEQHNPGMAVTGGTLREEFPDGSATTYVIFRGNHTPSGCCRDCGRYYIIARYSRYDRIDKGTWNVTPDVEDR